MDVRVEMAQKTFGHSLAEIEKKRVQFEQKVSAVEESLATLHATLAKIQASKEESARQVHDLAANLANTRKMAEDLDLRLKPVEVSSADIAQEMADLQTNLKQELTVGRVADVEQLAIVAASMAGDSLAAQNVSDPSGISSIVHGHELLAYHILLDARTGRAPEPDPENGMHVLEIGSTREKWWPQMSTSRLAAICRYLNYKLMSVDVDPLNTKAVLDARRYYNATIYARTAKGEDYLRDWAGQLPPYIYLDAYDYDHGKHSGDRQSRYLQLQGSEISDEACWEMHMKCAREFEQKCPAGGIVVFDDAFYADGNWSGKGKTAVPYMLEHSFEIAARTTHTVSLRKLMAAS